MRDSDDETGDRALNTGANGRSNRLWPNNIIPYEYKPDLGENMPFISEVPVPSLSITDDNCTTPLQIEISEFYLQKQEKDGNKPLITACSLFQKRKTILTTFISLMKKGESV